ncbi:uncharacterized protein [Dermacentor albipictus]|uniref:uncharacterized protein n=1 Tax=Dermacentor albipictus TaxID=60249 RepID=UPI0031FE1F13
MASTGKPHQRVEISDESLEGEGESLATPGDTSQMPSPVRAARSIWRAADPEPQDGDTGYETKAAPATGPSGRGSLVPCLAMLAAATLVFLFCLVALLTAHGNSAREQVFSKRSESEGPPSQDGGESGRATGGSEWWSDGTRNHQKRRKVNVPSFSTMAPAWSSAPSQKLVQISINTTSKPPGDSFTAPDNTSSWITPRAPSPNSDTD